MTISFKFDNCVCDVMLMKKMRKIFSVNFQRFEKKNDDDVLSIVNKIELFCREVIINRLKFSMSNVEKN